MHHSKILVPDVVKAESRALSAGMFGVYVVVFLTGIAGCGGGEDTADGGSEDISRTATVQPEAEISTEPTPQDVVPQSDIKVTFIELGSVNCIPCKMMQPVMKAVEDEYGDQVSVVFHDVWTNEGQPYAAKFGIKVIPTQIFLDKTGTEYFRHEGFFPKQQLVAVLKQQGVN